MVGDAQTWFLQIDVAKQERLSSGSESVVIVPRRLVKHSVCRSVQRPMSNLLPSKVAMRGTNIVWKSVRLNLKIIEKEEHSQPLMKKKDRSYRADLSMYSRGRVKCRILYT